MKLSGPGGAPPGALIARGLSGRVVRAPEEGTRLSFGRNRPDVDLSVGEDDRGLSRKQGEIVHTQGRWWLSNTGKPHIVLSRTLRIRADDEPVPLAPGYTTLLLGGSAGRTHLVEVYVVNDEGRLLPARFGDATVKRRVWPLNDQQRLVLTALGQRYLRKEPVPKPVDRQRVAELLNELCPGDEWDVKRVDLVVATVREGLSKAGVGRLTREEVGEPVGYDLSHNLLTELIVNSDTLGRRDLDAMDEALDG